MSITTTMTFREYRVMVSISAMEKPKAESPRTARTGDFGSLSAAAMA